MTKKNKLTEIEKETKIEEQRARVLEFAPSRMTKYITSSKQVAMLSRYPLTPEEKEKILTVVRQETATIEEAFKGDTKKKSLFSF